MDEDMTDSLKKFSIDGRFAHAVQSVTGRCAITVGTAARVSGCFLHPDTRISAFKTIPLVSHCQLDSELLPCLFRCLVWMFATTLIKAENPSTISCSM